MSRYRYALPQLSGKPFLTDGGLETTLIFHHGIDLPEFAAFDLLKDEAGTNLLRDYYRGYAEIARAHDAGFILEACTWRASSRWGDKLGHDAAALEKINRDCIDLMVEMRDEFDSDNTPFLISGCVGPQGDGYTVGKTMSADEAKAYHLTQIQTLKDTEADFVTVLTMNYVKEAIGVTKAAQTVGIPIVISFTVETDGTLPSEQSLQSAIEEVDTATNNGPVYYMLNCAHPSHYAPTLDTDDAWVKRIHGLRSNASSCSHAELDEAEELDAGNSAELGKQHRALIDRHPHINVHGGCCGTDETHIKAIADACFGA
ncbi:MAG: homocysteine S-methyltransferase family protein [Candidatus Hydrogenedentota bacterium]